MHHPSFAFDTLALHRRVLGGCVKDADMWKRGTLWQQLCSVAAAELRG